MYRPIEFEIFLIEDSSSVITAWLAPKNTTDPIEMRPSFIVGTFPTMHAARYAISENFPGREPIIWKK